MKLLLFFHFIAEKLFSCKFIEDDETETLSILHKNLNCPEKKKNFQSRLFLTSKQSLPVYDDN